MSTIDHVRDATSPQEALLALALTLDRIEAKVDNILAHHVQPADPWHTWTRPQQPTSWAEQPDRVIQAVLTAETHTPVESLARIEAIEALLATGPTAEDERALQAELRLLKEDGVILREDERAVRTEEANDVVTTVLPSPSIQQRLDWRAWANGCELWEFLVENKLPPEQFLDAYAEGGPLWLHAYDRKAVMAMPLEMRRTLVADVLAYAPAEARELGRDILKSEESVRQDVAVENLA